MKFRLLSLTERELYGADVMVTVDSTDMVATAVTNVLTLNLVPYGGGDAVTQPYANTGTQTIPVGTQIEMMMTILDTPFAFSDASIVNCLLTVGDSGSANRYLTSAQTELAQTPITYSQGTGTKFTLTTADNFIAVYTGTAAHNLSTCTAGSQRFFFKTRDWTAMPSS